MVRIALLAAAAASLLPSVVYGRPQASETFDYVIVGGGAAGSIVAARLSENPATTVLLLEAGPKCASRTSRFRTSTPNLFMSKYDYNYTLTAQPNLNNRVLSYFRGRILGGSTSINGMTYTRGPASDWDRLASYLGDSSWAWSNIERYFRGNEAFHPPPGGPFTPARFTPSVHGTSGPIGVSLNQETEWIIPPTLQAAEQESAGSSSRSKDGKRSSAATGYLAPPVRQRRNLVIRVDSPATRVVKNGRRFDTVEYRDASGNTRRATARRDLILSAGVVDTPVLLLRSGLGPAADLRAANISVQVDIPALGKHFIEHIGLPMTWSVNSTLTDDELDRNSTLYAEELAQWRNNGTGRLTQTSLTHIIFGRVGANESIWSDAEVAEGDPAGGEGAPHYEQIVSNKWTTLALPPTTGNYIGMTHFVTTPTSRGSITLNPASPAGMPLINPASLSTNWDKFVLRYAIRSTLAYMNAPVWQSFNITPTFDLPLDSSDEEVDAFIRSNAFGGAHGVSTARLGRANTPFGEDVVGPDFRVKGVQGLRIVDASVIPFMTNGHSMAPVYIVAERASDVIRGRN
ncbi:alcohol oxidase [Coprinellus micaceus]|uniref:pyranose dehydrogenase (acceptor) n=1 Tax=Coprinellus micaceus TaxID=71717 RepID=A0A4Y7SWL3_COPMI|nr:alcohol oxidase [Coprinellus micaceus]